jgi:uncharacterized Tic20 family protein
MPKGAIMSTARGVNWYRQPVRPPGPGELRASHADRDPVVERVKEAYAQGRLDKAEFDERLDAAMSARTHAELASVVRDLPPPAPAHGPAAQAGSSPYGAAAPSYNAYPVGAGRHLAHRQDWSPWAHVAGPPDAANRIMGAAGHTLGILTSFIGPLVLYLLADRRQEYARRHLAEAFNFQLTLLLVTIVTLGFGGILYAIAWVVSIVAGTQALAGGRFTYPLTLRLLH